jgi:hypothetical protein
MLKFRVLSNLKHGRELSKSTIKLKAWERTFKELIVQGASSSPVALN